MLLCLKDIFKIDSFTYPLWRVIAEVFFELPIDAPA